LIYYVFCFIWSENCRKTSDIKKLSNFIFTCSQIIIIRIVHEVQLKKASKHYNTMQKIIIKEERIHSLRTFKTYSRNTHIYIIQHSTSRSFFFPYIQSLTSSIGIVLSAGNSVHRMKLDLLQLQFFNSGQFSAPCVSG